jgi:protein-S-isoprenylcysteine O-methyltransferase Ste14
MPCAFPRRATRPEPRPTAGQRWLYSLFALCYAVPVALLVRAALQHAHTMNEDGWAPMAAGMVATYCAIAGLIMLGRALAWGRARRAFWIFPPIWLDHEPSNQVAG